MSDTTHDWEGLYQDARRETDLAKLLARVHAAEEAICRRWQELEGTSNNKFELEDINQAVVGLFAIKMEKVEISSLCGLKTADRTGLGACRP